MGTCIKAPGGCFSNNCTVSYKVRVFSLEIPWGPCARVSWPDYEEVLQQRQDVPEQHRTALAAEHTHLSSASSTTCVSEKNHLLSLHSLHSPSLHQNVSVLSRKKQKNAIAINTEYGRENREESWYIQNSKILTFLTTWGGKILFTWNLIRPSFMRIPTVLTASTCVFSIRWGKGQLTDDFWQIC